MASAVRVFLEILAVCVMSSVKAGYILRADFVSYNNSLHAYWNAESGNGSCCDGNNFPTNCSGPCNTFLRYCFKEYGTQNDISEDGIISSECLGRVKISGTLQEPTDYIDYSMPPLTTSNRITASFIILQHREHWPGQMQFFVRPAVGRNGNVIDYFVLDFVLSVGDTIDNITTNGTFFGSAVTFTVSLYLRCTSDFYGPDCVYCRPANSSEMGHYTCLSDSRKQCLPGYQNETTNCTTCVPAVGCHQVYGYCNGPGECNCLPGYGGNLCHQDIDVCGHTSPCHTSELCTNTGPDSYNCTLTPTTYTSTETDPLPLAVVVSIGGLLLLIIIFTTVVLVVGVAVRRGAIFQHVGIRGGSCKKKSGDGTSHSEIELPLILHMLYIHMDQGQLINLAGVQLQLPLIMRRTIIWTTTLCTR